MAQSGNEAIASIIKAVMESETMQHKLSEVDNRQDQQLNLVREELRAVREEQRQLKEQLNLDGQTLEEVLDALSQSILDQAIEVGRGGMNDIDNQQNERLRALEDSMNEQLHQQALMTKVITDEQMGWSDDFEKTTDRLEATAQRLESLQEHVDSFVGEERESEKAVQALKASIDLLEAKVNAGMGSGRAGEQALQQAMEAFGANIEIVAQSVETVDAQARDRTEQMESHLKLAEAQHGHLTSQIQTLEARVDAAPPPVGPEALSEATGKATAALLTADAAAEKAERLRLDLNQLATSVDEALEELADGGAGGGGGSGVIDEERISELLEVGLTPLRERLTVLGKVLERSVTAGFSQPPSPAQWQQVINGTVDMSAPGGGAR